MDVDAPSLQYLVVHPPEDGHAGRVFAHEILDLDLAGMDLVSLSACESALGRIDRADNLRGFPAALFSAGVSTVIGTLWEVNADASVLFFKVFYREYAGRARRLDAFRKAQVETRAQYPEYRDWGAFYLAGAWD
jgi:CHAT domain-containing protein